MLIWDCPQALQLYWQLWPRALLSHVPFRSKSLKLSAILFQKVTKLNLIEQKKRLNIFINLFSYYHDIFWLLFHLILKSIQLFQIC